MPKTEYQQITKLPDKCHRGHTFKLYDTTKCGLIIGNGLPIFVLRILSFPIDVGMVELMKFTSTQMNTGEAEFRVKTIRIKYYVVCHLL